jgi:hypothetical protein
MQLLLQRSGKRSTSQSTWTVFQNSRNHFLFSSSPLFWSVATWTSIPTSVCLPCQLNNIFHSIFPCIWKSIQPLKKKKGQTTDDQGKLKRRGRSQLLNNQKGMKCNQERLN